jgi:hypothetical protein
MKGYYYGTEKQIAAQKRAAAFAEWHKSMTEEMREQMISVWGKVWDTGCILVAKRLEGSRDWPTLFADPSKKYVWFMSGVDGTQHGTADFYDEALGAMLPIAKTYRQNGPFPSPKAGAAWIERELVENVRQAAKPFSNGSIAGLHYDALTYYSASREALIGARKVADQQNRLRSKAMKTKDPKKERALWKQAKDLDPSYKKLSDQHERARKDYLATHEALLDCLGAPDYHAFLQVLVNGASLCNINIETTKSSD